MSDRIHPRPLLARPGWVDLDGQWELAFDDDNRGIDEGWWQQGVTFPSRIQVPFPPESASSGVQEDGHSIIWYRRTAPLSRPSSAERVLLHFDAVDYAADVWVNGIHVGSHEGGQVGFHFDITHALAGEGEQVIVVRAFDDVQSLEQPRGKQDWEAEPHVIWYRRTSGIWRQVWAETVNATHLEKVRWTPGERPGTVTLDATATKSVGDDVELEVTFSVDGTLIGRSRHVMIGGQLTTVVELRDPRFDSEPDRLLWSPDSPVLIDVNARLLRGNETIDEVSSYVGLRTVGASDRHFQLNGRPYYLRLVLEQAFWPDSHLSAPSDEAIRNEVQLVKDLGFNGIRMHQVVADPRFLYWCDRLGLLVWADSAAAYRYSELSLERTTREWMEIIARDASHPSIVAWVAFNESWGVPDLATSPRQRDAVRAAYHLLRALDPSRLVIGNDGWEFVTGDLLGIHDYSQSAQEVTSRYGTSQATAATVLGGRPGGRRLVVSELAESDVPPVVLSEFGGVSFTSDEQTWAGYGSVEDAESFLARLSSLLGAVHRADGLAGFCYTQLTDTLQEANGLLSEQRESKADKSVLRSIISGQPNAAVRSIARAAAEEQDLVAVGSSSA